MIDELLAEAPVRRRSAPPPARPEHAPATNDDRVAAARCEAALLGCTTRRNRDQAIDDPGARLLRALTDQARLARVAAALPLTVMALGLDRGRRSAHALMLEYLADESPHLLARSETRAFARWLGTRLEPGVIVEVLRLEAAAFDAIIDGDVAEVRLRIDPPAVRASLSAGRLPELEPHDRYLVSVTG